MSKKLSVSSAFLSKIENGKSKPPVSWKRKIIELYALNEKQKLKFNIAFFKALNYNNINIKNYSAENRNMIILIAMNIDKTNADKRKRILDIVKNS